ncbi:lactate racemase domain-containing protein [Paenibacillus sp. J2TS4]|uniref:lactate racemase domain-containing protein n=1 Tax=Paenibacillus sp. J2TS4 TaxID=2807194 RepID=UPI001B0DCF68|nr:lactate racemase domain-containing protein [Paenibacillus sp. J2TS4]GIP31413.1 hypothetical protein J2TS4_06230 [Paenibacillus sp. J2TS4]
MFENIQVKVEGGFDLPFPRMIPVRQYFKTDKINHIPSAVKEQFKRPEATKQIRAGMKVAVAVGSRGIANLKQITASVISELVRLGARPFIVPAMGSHGGATAEGQQAVLAEYGITEEAMGCPIKASMETVLVGTLPGGIPLYFDKHAYRSDAVVIINRVKPHTDFKGRVESGLQKMIVIGLGKHKGASYIHSLGFDRFHDVIPEAGRALIQAAPIALGVAIIENAYDETCDIQVMPAEEICAREPILLEQAKNIMPRLLVDSIDVLIVDEVGKDVSGSGMDPNITGRTGSGLTQGFDAAPPIQKIILRDLTAKTHGNAAGFGMADIVTLRLFRKIDFAYTYANCITSTALLGAKIPMVLRSDKEALAIAIKTCNRVTPDTVKIVWIRNTLDLQHIYVSESYRSLLCNRSGIDILGEAEELLFDEEGNVMNPVFRR